MAFCAMRKRATPDRVKLMNLLMRKILNGECNYEYQRKSISVKRGKRAYVKLFDTFK